MLEVLNEQTPSEGIENQIQAERCTADELASVNAPDATWVNTK